MNPTVSIIVPIYNAEKYIRRCADSILNQEYTDFELLLIDDGSKDSSGVICDEYAQKDSRVRVIHKANSGVSDTRNIGIAQAKGTYLQFLDSDDWITPDATRLFVRAATDYNCDLVISDFYRVVGERLAQKGDIEEDGVLTKEEFASHMMENPADFYYGVLWNKLYRRDIIEKYQLRMDTQISWCEDFMFNLEYIRHAEIFYALHAPIYYYVKTKGSLVSQGFGISNTIKMKFMVFEYYNNFYKHVFDDKDYEKNRLSVYKFFLDAASDGVVPPSILGSKKLGEERSAVCPAGLSGNGVLTEHYQNRKLLDYYLESVALKHDLTLNEINLLLFLSKSDQSCTRKELSDFTGQAKGSLNYYLQKLAKRNLIKAEEKRVRMADGKTIKRTLNISFLPDAEPVLKELEVALADYDQARYAGFSEEELAQYEALSEKIRQNIQHVLPVSRD
ncbi:MAG: glycosyltransferase [Lachnospiraceae bacterium]|nr:glycosyltransferase [Lachnospiraceae bacterium]